MKNKHLSFDDRLEIEKGLKENKSFKAIGNIINKDCTTVAKDVAKEIKNHIIFKEVGTVGRKHFDCKKGKNCPFRQKGTLCNFNNCAHYEKVVCLKLSKPPYVCNGCKEKSTCTLSKQFYESDYAFKEYKENLTNARLGINFSQQELDNLDKILIPLVKEQGQSIHHAFVNNENLIMCSEKEIYHLIDIGALTVRNIDLPRKVRLRQTPKRKTYYKIDKKCLEGRKYTDFLKFIEKNPDTNVIQIDTVEGTKGGKVLLTIHFVNCCFMLAFYVIEMMLNQLLTYLTI